MSRVVVLLGLMVGLGSVLEMTGYRIISSQGVQAVAMSEVIYSVYAFITTKLYITA
jgi:hypothetical protein